ncbi:chaperone NapD [Alisedimentitalea sp. MJ-SS2]|uniref:chaperone NapD n=1 Tax=Aliisedimentitalea sp. MJ-SS2 TaxID=3049795 RepID=UPI00290930D1|nr:chaperone NapD [Alisedimentitalea sp. MJ-SS2]MDU8926774.1 chaperone NapD [Alisedimentitalea sp. MJ-SS2]
MTICSLVIYSKPEKAAAVETEVAALEAVEVHASDPKGKLVVTVDHPERAFCSDTIMGFHSIDGVINTALVYEYTE